VRIVMYLTSEPERPGNATAERLRDAPG